MTTMKLRRSCYLRNSQRRDVSNGFTLPAILVVVGALLLLVVGAMMQTDVVRRTTRTQVAAAQAELAVRSGLEEVRQRLRNHTANDDYLIMAREMASARETGFPYGFLVTPRTADGRTIFQQYPLFSAAVSVEESPSVRLPPPEQLVGESSTPGGLAEIEVRPGGAKVRVAWRPLRDARGRVVARYAYWLEDLQARLDVLNCGNLDGPGASHQRTGWPATASGPAGLAQVPLDPMAPFERHGEFGSFGRELIRMRDLMLTPAAPMFATGLEVIPPRDPDGRFSHPLARAVEESLTVGLRSYSEQPRLPHAAAIRPECRGLPRLNLNRLLNRTDRQAAVWEMANFIDRALPRFAERRGGMADDYVAALCAGALDYADADSLPTLVAGRRGSWPCRGMDAHPLVSEFLMRFRWEDVKKQDGRKWVILSASTYAELWNPTDQAISGEVCFSYETAYELSLAANPEVSLADLSVASPKLVEEDGYRWFPPQWVEMAPNTYRVVSFGTVTYALDAGPESTFVPSPLELRGEIDGASGCGYRMKWNGRLADQSRGGVHRNHASLHYPRNTRDQPRQRTRATIPGHTHTRMGGFRNNPGDPRMAWWLHAPQDANRYPDNYSPHRRNIRWGTIYRDDEPTKPKVHGRVMPSEWPDGGHNTLVGAFSWHTTDERVMPDDPRFAPEPGSLLVRGQPTSAPQRISNAGHFLSATELGHVHDPILWQTARPTETNGPWGDVTSSSRADVDYGGGNSLRIGRPEHPRFAAPSSEGMEAWRWLDLFHVGVPTATSAREREGDLVQIVGRVNVNTADRAVLRCLVHGALTMDPLASSRTDERHEMQQWMAPPTQPWRMSAEEVERTADRIADAIVATRRSAPFLSVGEVAAVRDAQGRPVFGDFSHLKEFKQLQLSDSAREETFARLHDVATVRSRNFRLWVVGQALEPWELQSGAEPEVIAESCRNFSLFSDPGNRLEDGRINPKTIEIRVIHESDF